MSIDNKIWAVVPSAGSGQRMQQAIPKQYLELQGRAVIEHTMATLLSEERITEVVVPIAKDDSFWSKLDCSSNTKVSSIVGGNTRSESVFNGITSLRDKANDDDWLLVHDAARPCLSQQILASFIEQLMTDEVGGILALPSNDTVKLACDSGDINTIEKTLDRNRVWCAQTPQMFRYGKITKALELAIQEGNSVTDEAFAMEVAGYKPRLIPGEARNLKVTRIDDLEMASLLLRQISESNQ